MVVNRTGIGQYRLFTGSFCLAFRLVITRFAIDRQITVEQVISDLLDLVKDTALVRHPVAMVIERRLKPWSSIADHQLGRLLAQSFGRELPKEGLPGLCIFALSNLPGYDFPVAIRPHPKGAEHDAFLFALHRPTTSLALHSHLTVGVGDCNPHAIDQDHRWGHLEGLRLEGLSPLPHRRHDTMARSHGPPLAQGRVHRLLQVTQAQPQTVMHHLLVEKRPPTALVAADRLPL